MQPRRNGRWLKKRNRGKGSLQPHKPKKRQNVPRAMTKTRTKTTSPSEEPSSKDLLYEPTKKELKKADQ